MNTVLGIFTGGRGRRMGGYPKGLLTAPGEERSLVECLAERFLSACPQGHVVLVGQHDAYAHLPFEMLADNPPGAGPIGGLHALFLEAIEKHPGAAVVTVGCDMPFISAELFQILIAQSAAAVAPRTEGHWQPMFCRYEPARALNAVCEALAKKRHSLYGILERVSAEELSLTEAQAAQLRDWDTQADVARDS